MQGITYLFLSITLSVFTVALFKLFQQFSVSTFQAILVNYVVCVLVGNITAEQPIILTSFWLQPWIWYCVVMGFLFITVFYSIGLTAQTIGVSVSMIAAKLSVVIPIAFAFLFQGENATLIKLIGIAISLLAIVLARKTETVAGQQSTFLWLLPLYVFVGSGAIDTVLNRMQRQFIPPATAGDLLSTIFLVALILGLLVFIFQDQPFQGKSLVWGLLLGIPNYFCMFFLVKSLSFYEASFLFPVNNIAIVVVSTFVSFVAFKEKMNTQNWVGFTLAIVSILLISLG